MNTASRVATVAVALIVGIGTTALPPLHAQSPASDVIDQSLTFEVASVKPNRSGTLNIRFMSPPGGRFTAENAPLRELIRMAYQLQPYQIIGAPSWTDSDRFDIAAKAPADTPPAGPPGSGKPGPMQVMMQNLLADRFQMKSHRETREMPIYALVLARPDGTLGPKLEKSTVDCEAMRQQLARQGGPPPPPRPGERPPCGMMMSPVSIAAGSVTITQLATLLGTRLGRTVVDRTGLTGNYAFDMMFSPEQLPAIGPPGAPPGGPPLINGQPLDAPSLFTALQEQLGLKLESDRGQVDVLVIDSINHPSED